MENINERAMLVSLNVKAWSAQKCDKRVTAEVAKQHNSDVNMGRYNKSLICKDALDKRAKLVGAARTKHYEYTLPWDNDGSRILSSKLYMEYTRVMREYRTEIDIVTEEFFRNYDVLVEDARIRLNGLFNPADYPPMYKLQRKFAFGVKFQAIPDGDDFRVDLGAEETQRVRDEIRTSVNDAIEGAMGDIWQRMQDVVSKMVERLRAYNVGPDGVSNAFRDSLVQNIHDLIALIPSLNITNNKAINDFAGRMRNELCQHSADTLRSDSRAREATAEAAEAILRQMEAFI